MSRYKIVTTQGTVEFYGRYIGERDTKNWHYYEMDDRAVIHFRKEHMVYIEEKRFDL